MNGRELHSYVWCEFDSEGVEQVEFLGGEAVVYSHGCPTRESSPNEDAACLIEIAGDRGLIAVADGVGGAAAGNDASRCAVESLAESCFELELSETHDSRGIRAEILDAVEFANEEITSWGTGAGSTLTIVELAGQQFRYFHVGDSGAMVTSNRGSIKFATVGHSPIAQAVEIGMLDAEEAFTHEDSNLLSNCLGSKELKIEIGVFQKLAIRDTVLLASDGLFDNLTQSEIADIIRKGDLMEQVSMLVESAAAKMKLKLNGNNTSAIGKPDDLSVVCWRANASVK